MERQSKALSTVMDEVDILRRNVEQFKFGKGDEPDAVAEWGAELDGEIKETDEAIAKLTDAINEVRSNHSSRDRKKQQELKQKEREEQLQFEKRQFELKLEYEQKLEETRKALGQGQANESKPLKPKAKISSKLPELKITKFNGKPCNWLTFWNTFEAEIDKSDLAPTTKFAYLKEMLEPNIRKEVDGLPFLARDTSAPKLS